MLGIVSDVNNFYDLILKEKEKAKKDAFTGCYHKNAFKELCERILDKKPRPTFAFLMLDLDGFKAINDQYGHAEGDKVLLDTVRQIRQFFPKQSLIGRFGGDEFLVLCPYYQKNSLMALLDAFLKNEDSLYSVTKSIGCLLVSDEDENFEEMLKKVDQALYEAKRKKNCAVCYPE